jgi:hypothetical protein
MVAIGSEQSITSINNNTNDGRYRNRSVTISSISPDITTIVRKISDLMKKLTLRIDVQDSTLELFGMKRAWYVQPFKKDSVDGDLKTGIALGINWLFRACTAQQENQFQNRDRCTSEF